MSTTSLRSFPHSCRWRQYPPADRISRFAENRQELSKQEELSSTWTCELKRAMTMDLSCRFGIFKFRKPRRTKNGRPNPAVSRSPAGKTKLNNSGPGTTRGWNKMMDQLCLSGLSGSPVKIGATNNAACRPCFSTRRAPLRTLGLEGMNFCGGSGVRPPPALPLADCPLPERLIMRSTEHPLLLEQDSLADGKRRMTIINQWPWWVWKSPRRENSGSRFLALTRNKQAQCS